ncbi:MAG: thiamine pyrophosphate-dependent dehydrogenase E1 component subunit alpha [Gemmatimonadetes bacterium]|nr:thiamine pyrophosphate-dependent dehydrogenase E1 component subunit alpha [Gemmatimonadota bacterium]
MSIMTTDELLSLYRTLFTIRLFEQSCIQLYREGLVHGYLHPYLGEEAIATGVCAALGPDDYIVSTHRGHGHCIARGGQIERMVAEIIGKETGYCRGFGGSMHIADMETGNLGANGIVGAGIPIGVGAALGATIRKEQRVCVVFTSDGAANHGTFGEALNLAAIWNLPLMLVVENNQFAVSTPIDKSSRVADLYHRGEGYGVHSVAIDGNDVVDVLHEAQDARQRCLDGDGPVLIEAKTYRQAGHHVNDPGSYMPADQVAHYKAHDPLLVCRRHLSASGADSSQADAIEAEVHTAMDAAVLFARDSPEPSVEDFLHFVHEAAGGSR